MARALTTAAALLRNPPAGRCELVRGEVRTMIPPGAEHGRVAMNLARLIANHVVAFGQGTVYAAETGFLLARNPDTVRAPDVAFVRTGRPRAPARGYYPGAPDLAVEVLSPEDRRAAVRAKVADWLAAGARAVWVVDPGARTVVVHAPHAEPLRFAEDTVLPGADLLPGLALPVRAIFA